MGWERGAKPGSEKHPTGLLKLPTTPVEGEEGAGVPTSLILHGPPSTPREEEVGRRGEEVHTGGCVDRLFCRLSSRLRLPLPLAGWGGCGVPGWSQGATLRYWRRGPHTMVVLTVNYDYE